MVTQLQPAKITIKLDIESAEAALDEIEERVERDARAIEDQTKETDGETPARRDSRQRREAKGGPAEKKQKGPSVPGIKLSPPDFEAIAVKITSNVTAAVLSAIPFLGPPLANVARAGIAVAVPAMEFGIPFALGFAEKAMEKAPGFKSLPQFGKDKILDEMEDKLRDISNTVSELRAKQAGMNAMFAASGDIVKTQLGMGAHLDASFLLKNAEDQFKIGEAKHLMGAMMEKAMKHRMGAALGDTLMKGY